MVQNIEAMPKKCKVDRIHSTLKLFPKWKWWWWWWWWWWKQQQYVKTFTTENDKNTL